MDTYLIICVALILLVVWYIRYTNRYAKRLIEIGLTAAQTYAYYGDAASRKAYITTCASMSKPHKAKLLDETNLILDVAPENDSFDKTSVTTRIKEIIAEAYNDDSGIKASAKHKEELESLSSEWLRAIAKCNLELANEIFKGQLVNNLPNQINKSSGNTIKKLS